MKNTKKPPFILDFQKDDYPYLEEVNEGILKQVELKGDGAYILDVGAGRAALGEALQQMGYKVCAIEANAEAAKEARSRVDQVLCVDLHDIEEIKKLLKDKKFKYIIFSDVLEHIFDPLHTVKTYLPLLEENGKLLISLPNALNWLNRFNFLFGRFNYELTGVMDRTHIRFFTFKSAKKLIEASGCTIERVDNTPFIVRAFLPVIKAVFNKTNTEKKNSSSIKSISESSFYKFYKKYYYPLEYWTSCLRPSLLAFRIILVARKKT